jgi:hypothetical protein
MYLDKTEALRQARPADPERVLLLRVASGTDWEPAGITGARVTAIIVRGLVQRDPAEVDSG